MHRIGWDSTVFETISRDDSCLDLVHTVDGATLIVAGSDSRVSDLGQIVLFSKKLLKEGLPKSLQERTHLFLHLHHLDQEVRQFNRGVQNSGWITFVHVLLLILTLGGFSFRRAMQIERLPLQVETFLGLKDRRDAEEKLRKMVTFEQLYRFPEKERETIASALGCDERYKKNKELLDQIAKEPVFASVMKEPLAALELAYIANDSLDFALRFFEEKAGLQAEVSKTWSVEKLGLYFGPQERRPLWNALFSDPKKEFIPFLLERAGKEQISSVLCFASKEDWKNFDSGVIEACMEQGTLAGYSISEQEFCSLPIVQTRIEQMKKTFETRQFDGECPVDWNFEELKKRWKVLGVHLRNVLTPQKLTQEEAQNFGTPYASTHVLNEPTSTGRDSFHREERVFEENDDTPVTLFHTEELSECNMSGLYGKVNLKEAKFSMLLNLFKDEGMHLHLDEKEYKQAFGDSFYKTFPTLANYSIEAVTSKAELILFFETSFNTEFGKFTLPELAEFCDSVFFVTEIPKLVIRVLDERGAELGESKEAVFAQFIAKHEDMFSFDEGFIEMLPSQLKEWYGKYHVEPSLNCVDKLLAQIEKK